MAIQRRLVEAVDVTENRVYVIRLKDIFDASTVNEFEKVVGYLLARNFYKIVVDLGHVEFISSAGWGAFKAELRRVREHQGDVKLANMSPDICDVFLLLELDSFIQSFDTVDEALAAFSQPVVVPDPGLARPSILQEIKAASHAQEMAEYGESSHSTYDQYATAERTEYAGDEYAGEGEHESSSVESHDDGVTEQAEYTGDVYADENEYENSSVESDNERGAAEPADRGVKARNNYAVAGDDGENGSDHLTLPAPAASGPEMWELILAGGKAPVDPYMFKESARMFPEEKKPQQFFASGATKSFSSRPGEEDSLPGPESEAPAPGSSSEADNAFEGFTGLGAAPDFSFAGHEPFVDDNSRNETDSVSASAEAGFEHAPVKSSPDGDDEFDEFETQDIRDPWILDEIDTLPEEYEMEEGAADKKSSSFAAAEILSYDLEIDESFSSFPDQARDYDAGGTESESSTHFAALSQTGADDSFDPPVKSKKKRTARTKKNKPKENFFTPPALDEHAGSITRAAELPSPSSQNGNDEVNHDYSPDGALPKIPASDNLEEIVRAVVATHPHFGPAMICKFIEDRFEPPVLISRSTVYRFLREAGLNRREKRQEYADQLFDPPALTEEI